jgi:SAM-dependent methyltransferase
MLKKIYKSIFSERQRNDVHFFLFRFRAFQYRGNEVECACCGGKFSTFLTYGNTPRENAVCPRCNALERNRVLWLYLTKELKIEEENWKVLHFAPERTLEKRMKQLQKLTYIGADLNPDLADYQMDITQIPHKENEFDLIICSHVLGHVPDEGLAIREMKRVLKTDGLAIVMTVVDLKKPKTYESEAIKTPAERLKNYGEDDLTRLHGLDFQQRLEAQGFEVEALDYRLTFSEADQKRLGLGQGAREMLFLCR